MLATIRYSLLSSLLLSRNLKVKIYKTIISPIVLYVCVTWFLTLREEHRLRMSENRVLRRIFGPKRDKGMGEWRKLHSGELHNLYSSPYIIRQMKSSRIRWVGHMARWERGETRTGFWWQSRREKDHLEGQGVDGRIGSEWTLGRLVGGCGVDSPGSGWGFLAGCCECGEETSGSGSTELVS
jgi:hypothetical protein